jgi:hypothetical protein
MDFDQAKTDWPKFVDYIDFKEEFIAEPKNIVHGLLDAGTQLLFGGASKTFKTWLQLDLALCICSGLSWLSFRTVAQPVIFVNCELSRYHIQKRLGEIAGARNICLPRASFYLLNLRDFGDFERSKLVELLTDVCAKRGIKMVFLDPFYSLLSDLEDENRQQDMRKALRNFRPLNKAEVASSFGIHFSKGNQAAKEPEDRIGGAGTLVRYVDSVVTLTRHKVPGAFTIEFLCRNHAPLESFVIEWQHPVMGHRPDLDPKDLKKPGAKEDPYDIELLYEFIVDHDNEFDRKELKDEVAPLLGWAERTVYLKIGKLLKANRVFISKLTNKINVKPK